MELWLGSGETLTPHRNLSLVAIGLAKEEIQFILMCYVNSRDDVVKTGKNTERIKPRIRYLCDTSKSFIYYTTRDVTNTKEE